MPVNTADSTIVPIQGTFDIALARKYPPAQNRTPALVIGV